MNHWMQTRRYTCPACGEESLHDHGHRPAVYRCPQRHVQAEAPALWLVMACGNETEALAVLDTARNRYFAWLFECFSGRVVNGVGTLGHEFGGESYGGKAESRRAARQFERGKAPLACILEEAGPAG